jgi:coatomer subunit beta'
MFITSSLVGFSVRTAKFIARKQWIVIGADDMFVRVYNYNTMEKLKTFEAHSDYIRCIAVHPTQPYILTSSDDMLIKLWDWDKNWLNTQIFEGHNHYVMQVVFNPKDSNTFASASLDRTIKVINPLEQTFSTISLNFFVFKGLGSGLTNSSLHA